MKKIFIALVLCAMTIAASAQIKTVDVKGNLSGDFGLGVGVTMGLYDKVDFSPSFNYFFTDPSCFTVEGDFKYNFNLGSSFSLYPILGIVYFHTDGYNKVGANIGAGANFNLTDKWGVFVEGKYQWVDGWDDSFFGIGVKYSL